MDLKGFAQKYLFLYSSRKTKDLQLTEGFEEECRDLGFFMDKGVGFVKQFPLTRRGNVGDLVAIIDCIFEPGLLGDAIYSHWTYITQFTQQSLLASKNRWWFIIAFTRLVQLSNPDSAFKGSLKSMTLVSNASLFCSVDKHSFVSKQRIYINQKGEMKFTVYKQKNNKQEISKHMELKCDDLVLKSVERYFKRGHFPLFSFDAGTWNLRLVNTEGGVYRYCDSLSPTLVVDGLELSALLRAQLPGQDVWAFGATGEGKKKPYMYLGVAFSPGGQEYSYLCDDLWVKPGDKVVIERGEKDRVATVVRVGFYTKKSAPYPFEDTKKVLGLAKDWN